MATSDIAKLAVFDARIVQGQAKYAVDKGALSVTNAPYSAIGLSPSQFTFNINVPSQNVFVDRAVDWSTFVFMSMTVAINAAVAGAVPVLPLVDAVVKFGRDCALAAFPLHELTSTMTATINDTSVVINTDTVLKEVLRLCDYKKNRLVRQCPTMLDKYGNYDDSYLAVNTPLASYLDATESAEVPNGAWWNIVFTDQAGTVLVGTGTYTVGAQVVNFVNGIPIRALILGVEPPSYPIFIRWFSTEKLVLSPFIFAAAHEYETGLFGINNIQLVINMKVSQERVIRRTTQGGRTITGVGYNLNTSVFSDAKVNVQFLTPSLDLELPPKSVVSYMEFPRYVSTQFNPIPAGTSTVLQSQNIVLPQIPDFLIIYVKPSTYLPTDGDYYLPITNISLNFDNFAGLLSSHTEQQLYSMAVHNGLEMDFSEWRGNFRSGRTGGLIQSVGGFLVLKPGQDFALSSGQASGLIGNFSLQFSITVQNTSSATALPQLFVITANSGFLESLGGSSRVIKGVLSEADIISAEPIPEMTRDGLARIVGAGFMDKLGSFLSKAKDIYSSTKPIVSGIKGMLPESGMLGKVRSGLSSVGYGQAGAGMAGAAMAGAAHAGAGRRSLAQRLM